MVRVFYEPPQPWQRSHHNQSRLAQLISKMKPGSAYAMIPLLWIPFAWIKSIKLLEKKKEEEGENNRILTIEPERFEDSNEGSVKVKAESNKSAPIRRETAVRMRKEMEKIRDNEIRALQREHDQSREFAAASAARRQVNNHRIVSAPIVAIPGVDDRAQ